MLRLLLVVAVLLLSIPVSAQDDVLQDTTLFLTFVPNVQFAPVYVAMEKGYFAAEGQNVTIEHGDEPVGIDLMAAGELDFGIVGADQVIAARANDRPIVFIYEWFQTFPIGLVVTKESGIEAITDLVGRHVGVPGRFGATYTGLVALLVANGLTENDIIIH